MTRAVDSSRLIAQARKLLADSSGKVAEAPASDAAIHSNPTHPPPPMFDVAVGDPLATTREVPGALALAGDEIEAAPVTRRATEEELSSVAAKAKPSPESARQKGSSVPPAGRPPAIRLGGRASAGKAEGTPPRPDARVHNRPTPPARMAVTSTAAKPPPTSPPPAQSPAMTSLRFPTSSLKDARARRATTKLNLNTAEILAAAAAERAEADDGLVDLSLDGLDSKPPQAPAASSLDELDVDVAVDSARRTMPPPTRRSDVPPSEAQSASTPAASKKPGPAAKSEAAPPAGDAKPAGARRPLFPPKAKPSNASAAPPSAAGAKKLSLAERMAGVVDQLTRSEAAALESVRAPAVASPTPVVVPRAPLPTIPSETGAAAVPAAPSKSPPAPRPSQKKAAPRPTPALKLDDVTVEIEEADLSDEDLADLEQFDDARSGVLGLDEPGDLSVVDSRPPIASLSDAAFDALDKLELPTDLAGQPDEVEAPAAAPAAAEPEPEDPELAPIAQRFERGDYLGVMMRAEALLERRPDFEPARRYLESAKELLKQMYLDKLGSGHNVPRLAVDPSELSGRSFDHRGGFLISFIDGIATVDEILDMSGMPQLEALRLLFELRQEGIVAVDAQDG